MIFRGGKTTKVLNKKTSKSLEFFGKPGLLAGGGVFVVDPFPRRGVQHLNDPLQLLPGFFTILGLDGLDELFFLRFYRALGHPIPHPPGLTLFLALDRRFISWQ
jgi:hypothetical protein